MMNHQDMLEIMERLHIDREMEMTQDGLEQILNEELSKPEDQMDAELVSELVQLLEDGVSEEARQRAWKRTVKQLKKERANPVSTWTIRIAATLLIVFGLTTATYKTAEALNWQQLLRLLRPFAETFMLYSGEQPEAETEKDKVYIEGSKAQEPQQYTTLEEAPDTLYGYRIKPGSMPERFAYLQGSLYSDDLNSTITHVYMGDSGICIFTTLIVHGSERTMSHLYEKTVEETTEMYIGGCLVAYYLNSDDATMSASWTLDNAQYSIFGVISEEELAAIVESTMNK